MAAWNGRGNLQQLVDELNRQKESRLDVVIEGRHLRVDEDRRLKPNTLVAQEWLPKEGRYSQQVEDGDSAHDFEALAGRVMGDRKLVHA